MAIPGYPRYAIGHVFDDKEIDEKKLDLDRAITLAQKQCVDGHVWAVWSEEDGEIMALVFAAKIYLPARKSPCGL